MPKTLKPLQKNGRTGSATSPCRVDSSTARSASTHPEKYLRTAGLITDGPFVEIKEKLGSLLIVKAADVDEAITLAHGCPALDYGGSVEIRPLFIG
ncbi:YciI family protein [Puia sp. P3]|uniref:YciI family protein n=1 Tax=Puia sp. P3 TaxID=3423952 RepID=UPI003D669C28